MKAAWVQWLRRCPLSSVTLVRYPPRVTGGVCDGAVGPGGHVNRLALSHMQCFQYLNY